MDCRSLLAVGPCINHLFKKRTLMRPLLVCGGSMAAWKKRQQAAAVHASESVSQA